MGKSLIIPGADFSAVAIPFIAKATIAANKTANIYNGYENLFATIPASENERTVDLTDILSEGAVLFDSTFSKGDDVFKKLQLNVENATSLKYAALIQTDHETVLQEIYFAGKNNANLSIEGIVRNQRILSSIDLSCLHGGIISAIAAFDSCINMESINLHNVKSIVNWTLMFRNCTELKTIDLSSLETISSTTPEVGTGPFLYDRKIETILCPALGVSGAKILIKELSAGPNFLSKYSGRNITTFDMSRFTLQTSTPDPATMTLWDENVWDNPVAGTTYYVDASLKRLYTYNG